MASQTDSPILELVGISKIFDKDLFKKNQHVINGLSCKFPQGRCTGLMGHNGAGKTSTIRIIFGLIKPTKGQVFFKGKPINIESRRAIGYMPETNKLPMGLSCEEILMYQLQVHKPKWLPKNGHRDTMKKKLDEVGLWGHRRKKVSQLSKGMGRRLAWAQATVHNPELLVLDEPFSGLDPVGRNQMRQWIRDFKEKKASIIICTHELSQAFDLCDELHIMRQGTLVYSTVDQDEPSDELVSYYLQFSGCDAAGLEPLRQKHGLPAWKSITREGFLAGLEFETYPDAASWLKFCMNEGFVVTQFKNTHSLNETKLLKYFEGGL